MPAQYAAAYADYQAALDRAGRSEHTRRAHVSRVAGYLGWLAGADLAGDQAVGDPTGADPLADAWARDFAVRDYRVWLLTVAKKAPNTVNAHLTAVDAFYTHRGLGPATAGRVDLPQQAPRALEEAELRRVLGGAERLPSTRDKTIVRTLYYSGCAPPSLVDRGRRRHRHLHHPAQTVAPAGEGLPRFMTTRPGPASTFFIPGIRALQWIAEGR